jgi:TRAP-type C4-dicarboxylate transport system permease small subunit
MAMRRRWTQALNGLETVIESVLGALMCAFTLIILLDVIFRYCLHVPLAWPAELSILMFQWMIFLGTPVALRHGLHFHVEAFISWMPVNLRKIVSLLVAAGILGAACVLVAVGWQLAAKTAGSMYTTLPVSHSLLYFSIVACGILTAIFAVERIFNAFVPSQGAHA